MKNMKLKVLAMMLIGALLFGVGTAFGTSNFLKKLDVIIYPDLAIYFNGVKDSASASKPGYYNNGTSWVPKTMIYQGTTYVPLRYFANQMGIATNKIGWDEASHAIWVGGEKPAATTINLENGQAVFKDNCLSCHGDQTIAPQITSSGKLTSFATESELKYFIMYNMPKDNPGSLSEEQYKEVATYLWKSTHEK
jgi:mono/diheme cytochrome c family protein